MTQEDKNILLKDLCARLPHYTMVLMGDGGVELLVSVNVDTGICNGLKGLPKPYLRPLSSMTEKEKEEYNGLLFGICDFTQDASSPTPVMKLTTFFYSHHLDCGGMIEKGLALEAPEDMYKSE